ncbi:MAG: NYN domain-containing protein, partial [Gemmatimonadota bacterium]
MTAQFARAPQRGRPAGGTPIHEPHAALLIDFDNVTMGIRSDLTKELKNLLNSDIIKGKVAVQRAYADWRRYPQYIVPLAESSVDLIFAPAYGSAKKNATDIRLAIDAVELVFTRPEIGTIILLSGDSDFSSLVLKLKEYGKYVIGVGIRESASDLLVQNCDEYYSYSALTGLTRAGEEQPVVSEDPWELVALAVGQMVDNNDVMRSDRLKQVLLELDPAFDEKALGFQKFNKFLQEAATRGLLVLRKQENGQYDVGAGDGEPVPAAADSEQRESRRSRGRRGRGGRRDEPRRDLADDQPAVELRPESVATGEEAEEPPSPAPVADAASSKTAPPPRAEHEVEMEPVAAAVPAAAAPAAAAPAEPVPPREAAEASEPSPAREKSASRAAARGNAPAATTDLKAAYSLLRRAATDLVRKSGGSARDSDVKRRMLELEPGWDEAPLGFSKFSRFLRQAHDAEVVTLRKGESGNYDVVPGNAEVPAGEDERGGRRDRERSTRGRTPTEEQTAAAARDAAPGTRQEERPTRTAAAKEAPVASAAAAVAGAAPTPSSAIGFRRG